MRSGTAGHIVNRKRTRKLVFPSNDPVVPAVANIAIDATKYADNVFNIPFAKSNVSL